MRYFLKIVVLLVAIFIVDLAFGQGCAQCKQVAQETVDSDSIESVRNEDVYFRWIIYKFVIPAVIVITIILLLIFRKKIASLFRKKSEG